MNEWYRKLNKAPWTPPDWTFGVIWSFLYLLMIIALYLVWSNKKCYPYCDPITYFFIQLFFNLIWTTLFFKLKQPLLALLDICIIITVTAYTTLQFHKLVPMAAYLLVPYLLWLCVAFSLNLYVLIHN